MIIDNRLQSLAKPSIYKLAFHIAPSAGDKYSLLRSEFNNTTFNSIETYAFFALHCNSHLFISPSSFMLSLNESFETTIVEVPYVLPFPFIFD